MLSLDPVHSRESTLFSAACMLLSWHIICKSLIGRVQQLGPDCRLVTALEVLNLHACNVPRTDACAARRRGIRARSAGELSYESLPSARAASALTLCKGGQVEVHPRTVRRCERPLVKTRK